MKYRFVLTNQLWFLNISNHNLYAIILLIDDQIMLRKNAFIFRLAQTSFVEKREIDMTSCVHLHCVRDRE